MKPVVNNPRSADPSASHERGIRGPTLGKELEHALEEQLSSGAQSVAVGQRPEVYGTAGRDCTIHNKLD